MAKPTAVDAAAPSGTEAITAPVPRGGNAFNIWDLRDQARRRLPRGMFEYVDRGTEDEVALENNREAIERIKLRPRVCVDVSRVTQIVEVFGKSQRSPLIIAPTGAADLLWFRGELALARAAAAKRIPFTLATSSTTAIEAAAEAAQGRLWLQMYLWDDRALSYELLERAKAAGVETLVLTVDTPVLANREFNQRNGFTNPFRMNSRIAADLFSHPRWLAGVMLRYLASGGMPRFVNYPDSYRGKVTEGPIRLGNSASVTWGDLRELRKRWPKTLIVKGVLEVEDSLRAAECGVDGIVVSNHGGRNLDSTIAPIEALPHIADAVGDRVTVLFDSGIRRGSDVVKALALGAKSVLIGRATLYGLASGGEVGVLRALTILQEEIDRTLAFLGVCNVGELSRSMIRLP
ncbi:MAG TPA: alpha-hydroxy acid oxidase [Terriglobales bacterium]|nr:alpha-hydroxy acid oxidase [Terriglobales bacterium]